MSMIPRSLVPKKVEKINGSLLKSVGISIERLGLCFFASICLTGNENFREPVEKRQMMALDEASK